MDRSQHLAQGHIPGTLYDCPACESECHCEAGAMECVYDGEHNGLGIPAPDDDPLADDPAANYQDGPCGDH